MPSQPVDRRSRAQSFVRSPQHWLSTAMPSAHRTCAGEGSAAGSTRSLTQL